MKIFALGYFGELKEKNSTKLPSPYPPAGPGRTRPLAQPRGGGPARRWAKGAIGAPTRQAAAAARFHGISRSTRARPQVPVTPAKTSPAPTKPDSA